MYEQESAHLQMAEKRHGYLSSKRVHVSLKEAAHLQSHFPRLPHDYAAYLVEIGYGSAFGGDFTIYSGPFLFDETFSVCPVENASREAFLLFGGDIGGDLWGFLTDEAFRICEWDHETGLVDRFDGCFKDFIRQKIGLPSSNEEIPS